MPLALAVFAAGCGEPAAGVPASSSPQPDSAPVELWIGGDVHLGDDTSARLSGLDAAIAGAVGIINLEGPVAAAAPSGAGVRLHNVPPALASLRSVGVRVAGIANNHSLDAGPEGPERTAQELREAGLVPAGLDAGPAVIAVAGRRIVVTAHDLGRGAPPANLGDELAAARAKSDVLVATFHVSGPASYLPRAELRRAADIAIAAGARVVAAHGTHAVGPVERRADAVVAWGLGNLTFSCDCTSEIDGAILRVSLSDDRVDARIVPIDAGLRGAAARPAHDPKLMFELFEAIGSSPITRERGPVLSASF
jgi:poly-gamma-glutamate capsule biosynthesis protein CapA/YwtB (metallophosphatase superfamily)